MPARPERERETDCMAESVCIDRATLATGGEMGCERSPTPDRVRIFHQVGNSIRWEGVWVDWRFFFFGDQKGAVLYSSPGL